MGESPTSISRAQPVVKTTRIHGCEVSYREAGAGPVLLLLHGIAGTAANWDPVIGPWDAVTW